MTPPAPAHAHTGLERASPGPGQEVAPGVDVVALTFRGLRADGPKEITVTGPGNTAIPIGEPVLVNAETLCAAVEPLAAGVYAVSYRVTSRDGHPIDGRYLFEVTGTGSVLGYPEPCQGIALPDPSVSKGGDSRPANGVIAAAGGLATLVAGLAIGALVLRVQRQRTLRHQRIGGHQ